jgi:hypothetical protein
MGVILLALGGNNLKLAHSYFLDQQNFVVQFPPSQVSVHRLIYCLQDSSYTPSIKLHA